MAVYFSKQPASRPTLTTTEASTSAAIKVGVMTNQIRIVTTTAGSLVIADTTSTTTGMGVAVPFAAGVAGEYFTVTPGQYCFLCAGMTVTEMT